MDIDCLYPKAHSDTTRDLLFYDHLRLVCQRNRPCFCWLDLGKSLIVIVFDVVFKETLVFGDLVVVDDWEHSLTADLIIVELMVLLISIDVLESIDSRFYFLMFF